MSTSIFAGIGDLPCFSQLFSCFLVSLLFCSLIPHWWIYVQLPLYKKEWHQHLNAHSTINNTLRWLLCFICSYAPFHIQHYKHAINFSAWIPENAGKKSKGSHSACPSNQSRTDSEVVITLAMLHLLHSVTVE